MKNQTPTARRLHESLGKLIAGLSPGDRLLSEPELSRQLGVSRATLREAMRTFETQGLIHRRQGSGTFVAHPTQVIESGMEVLESIETIARRIGLPVALGETHIESRQANAEEANALGISQDKLVVQARRVILAEGQPAAYLIDTLPVDVLSPEDLNEDFSGSVLDLLIKRDDITLDVSRCEISAVTASPEIARAMGIQRGDVLLCLKALLYDRTGCVIDYSFGYFLPGHFRFHVVRRIGQLE
jgi:GntR family transcriptional regulator